MSTRIWIGIVALALMFTAFAPETYAGEGKEAKQRQGDGERKAQHEQRMLKRFDKDGDGKLSDAEKSEAEAHRTGIVKKYDADGDGKLSEAERKAAREAGSKRLEGMIKRFDKDGDGKLSDEEKAAAQAARAEMAKKYDTDGDGKLSEAERKAAREARQAEQGKKRGESGKKAE